MHIQLVHDAAGDARPGISAVETAAHPANLHTCPDDAVVRGVHLDREDAGGVHVEALVGEWNFERLPVQTTVARAEHPRRRSAGKHG
jgi:hypothetical protein